MRTEMQQLSSNVRVRTRKERCAAAAATRAWQLNYQLRSVALIIYVLTSFCHQPAVVYLQNCGRVRHWPERAEDELEDILDTYFCVADVNELIGCAFFVFARPTFDCFVRLADVSAPLVPAFMKPALRYVGEWKLVCEGEILNLAKGVAPTTRMLVDQARHLNVSLPLSVAACGPSLFGCPNIQGRVWAQRFRARWGVRLGKIKLVEPLSPEEMETKVRVHVFLQLLLRFPICSCTCGVSNVTVLCAVHGLVGGSLQLWGHHHRTRALACQKICLIKRGPHFKSAGHILSPEGGRCFGVAR